jgi:hypothetical protein
VRVLARLDREDPVRRRVARCGHTERTRAAAARLRAVRCDRRRAHDVAARMDRRLAQLGLPLHVGA